MVSRWSLFVAWSRVSVSFNHPRTWWDILKATLRMTMLATWHSRRARFVISPSSSADREHSPGMRFLHAFATHVLRAFLGVAPFPSGSLSSLVTRRLRRQLRTLGKTVRRITWARYAGEARATPLYKLATARNHGEESPHVSARLIIAHVFCETIGKGERLIYLNSFTLLSWDEKKMHISLFEKYFM